MNVTVDLRVYPLPIVLRACHPFTARYFVSLHHIDADRLAAQLTPRDGAGDERIAGEFANALLDFRLRAIVAEETTTIRELLIAQAFCETDLLDRSHLEASEDDDPRGIVA